MKRNICKLADTGSDTWLKEFREALNHPTFKYTPAKNQLNASFNFKGKKLVNMQIAQSYSANHDPIVDQMKLASAYHNPEACESWDDLYINKL